ncbi:NAD-binding protein [Rhizorhabdus sp. FW153]|uniref:NAD-binding protein n=1 Tax=Rhizorhabdus sp. FW153 TaxID=3400216 RepID=UPI003CED2C4D
MRNATLEAVHVQRARSIIVSAGRDDISILIVLTARGLAPDVPISVAIRSEDNKALARQAGACASIAVSALLDSGSRRAARCAMATRSWRSFRAWPSDDASRQAMESATASATLMPSTAADRIPPA